MKLLCRWQVVTILMLKTSKHLTAAIRAMKAMQCTSGRTSILPKKKNKTSEKQFFNQKETSWCVPEIYKPLQKEVDASKWLLLSQITTCCGICLQEDDKSSEDFINLVQCSSCEVWLHVKCATGQPLHNYETCILPCILPCILQCTKSFMRTHLSKMWNT